MWGHNPSCTCGRHRRICWQSASFHRTNPKSKKSALSVIKRYYWKTLGFMLWCARPQKVSQALNLRMMTPWVFQCLHQSHKKSKKAAPLWPLWKKSRQTLTQTSLILASPQASQKLRPWGSLRMQMSAQGLTVDEIVDKVVAYCLQHNIANHGQLKFWNVSRKRLLLGNPLNWQMSHSVAVGRLISYYSTETSYLIQLLMS